ncbi:hypothetical protein AcV5_000924 [Taiwanofungus camphoratus]|nr:hypothetical protein AcW2_006452 [Antrodia cinnamomea]KAI0939538.1 hypothetical protein AcV5_000924 [Antrodia cinnamomea]KAI0952453.1 hypothetical protein AcV7_008255 [Antrodia cinnamomea]
MQILARISTWTLSYVSRTHLARDCFVPDVPNAVHHSRSHFARRASKKAHTDLQEEKYLNELPQTDIAYCAPFPRRTHTCGALSSVYVDSRVVLTGWLLPERKVNKKLSFFNVRDSSGSVQLVVSANASTDVLSSMREVPTESTILVEGIVRMRGLSHRREYPGGDIEIIVDSFTLLNPADRNLPFMPSDTDNLANENLRLRYRYLDLRRSELSANLKKRSNVAHIVRTVFHEENFTEVETPILLKSTPEGAREFLVPTRITSSSSLPHAALSSQSTSLHPTGTVSQPLFYALPQSPQQPKQLLIASGAVDRYYQIARCFRDEDGRKDRQPEFTQVDFEMAWVGWGEPEVMTTMAPPDEGHALLLHEQLPSAWRIGGREVREVVEKLVRRIWSQTEGIELPEQFRVMTYEEAMRRYGSDKPDLRFGLEIEDIMSFLPAAVRTKLAEQGEIIEALIVRNERASAVHFLRAARAASEDDTTIEKIEVVRDTNWVAHSQLLREVFESANRETDSSDYDMYEKLKLKEGSVMWLARRRRKAEGGSTSLGRMRLRLATEAQQLGDLELSTVPQFLWVTEFPLFTRADADKEFLARGRWSSSHHPFTAPMWQDIDKMYKGKIDEVRGQHYDLVLNGVEIGGGSVRVHDAAMQEYIFTKVLQLDNNERTSFGHLLHALRCGAPPHGGFAFGFDRLMAILCKAESIRDVIAFPKTGAGTDLLFKSPAPANSAVLAQYNIRS